jgi:ATP-dependent helicase/nuclease subunit B
MGKVVSISAGGSFAHTVAERLLQEVGQDPLALAGAVLWVPAPRQAQAIREALITKVGHGTLLPSIRSFSFKEEPVELAGTIPPQRVISPLARLIVLTRLIRQRDRTLTYSQAWAQAESLAQTLDLLVRAGVDPVQLKALPPAGLAQHWQRNLDFLKIVFDAYPAWLREQDAVDEVVVNQQRLYALAKYYKTHQPAFPVWAVGFADTTPAGAEVLAAVVDLPAGCLILPGLDQHLPEPLWAELPVTHAQASLKELLAKLHVSRPEVEIWNTQVPQTTYSLIEAEGPQEEAASLALVMRESLQDRASTCALVTPDRALATRVRAELERWQVSVDDSAGLPLTQTPSGVFLLRITQAITTRFSPLAVAELIKHPFCRFGESNFSWKAQAQALEKLVLRGIQPDEGLSGLRRRWHAVREEGAASREELKLADKMLTSLAEAYQPLTRLSHHFGVKAFVTALCEVADQLGADENRDIVWREEQLEEALLKWQQTSEFAGEFDKVSATEGLEKILLFQTVHQQNRHPRLFIWGPLEARLQKVDRVILAGLNEGTWPVEMRPNPWLNRRMFEALSLPLPERAIGLAAHDISQFLAWPDVVLSRSQTVGKSPAAASRFLKRWERELGAQKSEKARNRGAVYLHWAAELARQGATEMIKPAAPSPGVSQRPVTWSATTVEALMTCPYKAYARKILKVEKQPGFAEPPDVRNRGQLVHKWLEAFFMQVKGAPPPFGSVGKENEAEATEHLALLADHICQDQAEIVRALWLPRLKLLAPQVVGKLLELQEEGWAPQAHEVRGTAVLNDITLFAQADRVDSGPAGVVLVDYKTGDVPKARDVALGIKPQLAVEAWLQQQEAFGVPGPVAGVCVWEVPIGSRKELGYEVWDIEQLGEEAKKPFMAETEAGLKRLVAYYAGAGAVYAAVPGPNTCKYCDFAGLCRKDEWGGEADGT